MIVEYAFLISLDEYPDVFATHTVKDQAELLKILNRYKAKYPKDDIAYRIIKE